ncbi:MAG: hypothetical protein ACYC9P_12930, partial [Rudaea sp.]
MKLKFLHTLLLPYSAWQQWRAATRRDFQYPTTNFKFCNSHVLGIVLLASAPVPACANDGAYFVPQLLGAQYTFIDQHQDALRSPYAGPLSLDPRGDTEQSHTFG